MVKNLALAAIVGMFAASAVVAAPEGTDDKKTVVASTDTSKDAKEGTAEKSKDEKAEPAPAGK